MTEGKERFTCDWIYDLLVVLCDGKVVCGCADPNGERPVGHLRESGILEIWNNPTVTEIRKGLNEGYSPFCLECGLKRKVGEDYEIPQRPTRLEVLPRIFLEPTVLCNIDCFGVVCNKESGIVGTRARKLFPLDEFEALIDEIGAKLIRLDLFNYGDPFVHPQAVEMIEYVKGKFPHIFLYASTNGLMLDEEKIRRIVKSGMDEITFSVDGADSETYLRYRRGGDFDKVLGIMRKFVDERNRLGREVPFINWRYILFSWNDSRGKMNAARRLAEEVGVDRLSWEITDHPKEAISRKYQIGTRAWRRIHHEIWDTSQSGNAIRSKRNLARIRVLARELRMSAGEPLVVQVRVKNVGGARWPKSAYGWRRSVRLGAQLHDADKNLINLDYARAFLPRDVLGGETCEIDIELPALQEKGRYFLRFDMVAEGIDWFDIGGSKVTWRELIVE